MIQITFKFVSYLKLNFLKIFHKNLSNINTDN